MSKKFFLKSILAVTTCFLITSCNGQKNSRNMEDHLNMVRAGYEINSDLDYVKLNVYLIGERPSHTDYIYEEINKMLNRKINTTIVPKYLSWSEHVKKYPVILAGGDDVDLITAAVWTKYFEHARKGAFLAITDEMIDQYMPLTKKRMPVDKMNSGVVPETGKRYMIPANFTSYYSHCYIVRQDLMKKYNIKPINNMDNLGLYLEAVKQNEPDMTPYSGSGKWNHIMAYGYRAEAEITASIPGAAPATAAFVCKKKGPYQLLTHEEIKAYRIPYYQRMREWFEKGFWNSNVPFAAKDTDEDFINGHSALTITSGANIDMILTYVNQKHPAWEVGVYPVYPNGSAVLSKPDYQNGMAVPIRAENPERALMALDLLKNDREINMITMYGIEGEYFELTKRNTIKLIGTEEQLKGFPVNQTGAGGWRDSEFELPLNGSFEKYKEIQEFFTENAIDYPLKNFIFNPVSAKDIHQKLLEITEDKLNMLSWGLVPMEDIERTFDEVYQERVNAGIEEYKLEINRQIHEYLKMEQK